MKAISSFLMSLAAITLIALGLGCAKSPAPNVVTQSGHVSQIIGGELVSNNEALAQSSVAIRGKNPGEDSWYTCSAALIASDIVITAAHCAGEPGAELQIIFGLNFNTALASHRFNVRAVRAHHSYPIVKAILEKNAIERTIKEKKTLFAGWNDIALLQFDGKAPNGFTPVTLLNDSNVLANQVPVILSGYGIYEITDEGSLDDGSLRKVTLPIYKADFNELEFVVDQRENRGSCRGDSGGAVFVEVGDTIVLAGITSHGITKTKTCNGFAAVTNILAFRDWVNESLLQLQSDSLIK